MKRLYKKVIAIVLSVLAVSTYCLKPDSDKEIKELKSKYDYVGSEFEGPNGCRYVEVSVPNDSDYAKGWYNLDTDKEDVQTKKFKVFVSSDETDIYYGIDVDGNIHKITFDDNSTNDERVTKDKEYNYICTDSFKINDVEYKRVSRKDNNGCEMGWLNLETYNEDIKCRKFDFIDSDCTLVGGTHFVKVSIPDDDGYAFGYYNLDELEMAVPCATYDYINIDYNNASFDCFKSDNTVDVIKVLRK